MEAMTKVLLERETINAEQIAAIMNGKPLDPIESAEGDAPKTHDKAGESAGSDVDQAAQAPAADDAEPARAEGDRADTPEEDRADEAEKTAKAEDGDKGDRSAS